MLTYGIWSFKDSLFKYEIERIETFQGVVHISEMEGYGIPIYVHPNKGVGPTFGAYDLAIRIEYKNVNGTLYIEDFYSDFGTLGERTHKLHERNVSGNGSTTFKTGHNYVGVHLLVLTPDYNPIETEYNPIEIEIYTIHYEPTLEKELIFYSLTFSFIGTILASIGMAIAIVGSKQNQTKLW